MADVALTLAVDTSEFQEWLAKMGPVYAAAPDLLATLKAIEWAGFDILDGPVCPSCGAARLTTHAPACVLGSVLAKAEGRV